ncbi:MAG: Na+/H+ antiporter NhaA [Actinomycetota bacterium]|nr:Na+/H+ antiporter NhaA [Actinomycetota bacterium]
MSEPEESPPRRLLSRGTWPETRYVASALRTETVGGALLLGAALIAIVWANSPWSDAYQALGNLVVGPQALHLDLSLDTWAADGLLAVFFLVAGLELKREFVAGDLSDRSKAALPVAAAICGVALPAILYAVAAKATGGEGDVLRGWAIPTATDIAFALAVLAVISTHLPSALRSFLLTLAVVDDLIAITIIAVFYTDSVAPLWLALAVVPLAVWHVLLRKGWTNPLLLAVPALLAWGLVHSGGVHATVAGVLLGLLVPVSKPNEVGEPSKHSSKHSEDSKHSGDEHSLAERVEHKLRPWSAGVAVPIFAFFAAGVPFLAGGLSGITDALTDPAALGVVVGLVVGKCLGVFGGSWVFARFTKASLDDDLAWPDMLGLSLLAGVGFTVSLLIGELAFGPGSPRDDHVSFGVLVGSLLAAALAAVVLRRRNRHYARLEEREMRDDDGDGIPDVYLDRPPALGS